MIAYRRHQNKLNYDNGNFIVKSYRRFDDQEDWEVLCSEKTDRQIAKELERSTKSIQLRRYKILTGKVQSAYSQSEL